MRALARPLDVTTVQRKVAGLFSPRPHQGPLRLGAEIELLGHHAAGSVVPAQAAALEPLIRGPHLSRISARDAMISFEPGAQLEFSTAPQPGLAALVGCVSAIAAAAIAAGRERDIRFIASGTDPLAGRTAWPLAVDTPRYRVMQAHFDALGPKGRCMMRQTAALQVCVETSPSTAADTWLVLNHAGPALTALFANSPVCAGRRSGEASARTGIWLEADMTRTGFDGLQVDARDPVDAYLPFAMHALAMPLPRDGRMLPGPASVGFGDWIDSDAGVDDADVEHHLSTLFPPVRPRGDYFEVRYLDALPLRFAVVALITVAVLAHDDGARAAARESLGHTPPDSEAWRRAARYGVRDRAVVEQALLLLDIVIEALRRRPTAGTPGAARVVLEYRERFPESGRCPGDDLDDLLRLDPEGLSAWI